MDVYFIPVGPDRYELYCDEAGDAEDLVGDVQPTGRFASIYHKFKSALARVEAGAAERREARCTTGPRSWTERMKDRALCWIAEKIAEQRLLWRLRKQNRARRCTIRTTCRGRRRSSVARAELQREADRHLKWIIIDGALFVGVRRVFLVPGPNVVAYYFGFRLVGHYLSRRGAKHALDRGRVGSVSEPAAVPLAAGDRARRARARSRSAPGRVRAASAASRQILRANLGEDRVIFSERASHDMNSESLRSG